MKHYRLLITTLILLLAVAVVWPALAQETTPAPAPISFTGPIEAVGDGAITVGGLTVNISGIDGTITSQFAAGITVEVSGSLQDGVVIAAVIIIITGDDDTPVDDGVINGFVVSYGGRSFDGTNTTFTYTVTGTGTPPALSHFDVEIPVCEPLLDVAGFSPSEAVSVGSDPTTGIDGIKWDLPLNTDASRTYSITFAGDVGEGTVLVAVKGGPGFEATSLPGPSCSVAGINLEKFVSSDGATWLDADDAPGPDVDLEAEVFFRFVVTNTGDVELTDLALSDDMLDTSACTIPASLATGAFFECQLGPLAAVEGQHTNVATVTAVSGDQTVTDTDSANYWGGDRPEIALVKDVSVDGGASWSDANSAPGPRVDIGEPVSFRFTVTNTGNVAVGGLTLMDSTFDTSSCTVPEALEVGASFECVIGPFDAVDGQHTNMATATALFGEQTLTVMDAANYFGGEPESDLPITIVIEGPVESININIIVIYGIQIELDDDDPLLTVIQIGDILRIEGDVDDLADGNTIIIIAITVIFINIDVVVDNDSGTVWRDSGNCDNPPPPWAPANGWRRRCEGGGSGSGSGS
jgi:hypothetical protein